MSGSVSVPFSASRRERYELLFPQLEALVDPDAGWVANVSNIVAAIKEVFGFLWVGVYTVRETEGAQELVLGPFQGTVACTRIAYGKGVCGTAWMKRETIIVPDVDLFPGHIACSGDSRSEIVVPVIKSGNVAAVLDVDSSRLAEFGEDDAFGLGLVSDLIARCL